MSGAAIVWRERLEGGSVVATKKFSSQDHRGFISSQTKYPRSRKIERQILMQIDAHKNSGPGETPRRPRSRAPLLPPSQTSASHKKNSKIEKFYQTWQKK